MIHASTQQHTVGISELSSPSLVHRAGGCEANTHAHLGWTPAESANLYGLGRWGAGYFDLLGDGTVAVSVRVGGKHACVSLLDIIAGMQQRGLRMPVLLRIENILDAQVSLLNDTFERAMGALRYRGGFRGVFPIKVNQQCQVIEEVARCGSRYGHGLEAGSKAELLVALASMEPGSGYIVCNGYKDAEFITLGLRALQMGHQVFLVIETPTELPIIVDASRKLGIRPLLGIRAKLTSRVTGAWSESSGDRSLFGLTTSQIVGLVDSLKQQGMLDCLQLLHYHLGSQVPEIRDIRNAVLEATRYYVDLKREGAPLGFLDVGGGLAVDYEGSRTVSDYSKNYSLDEYCTEVVTTIMGTLDPLGIDHPVIITESGRAIVAYSSILMFNIIDVARFEARQLPDADPQREHELIGGLRDALEDIGPTTLQACHDDAVRCREALHELFKQGQVSLRDLSLAEDIFLGIVHGIVRELHGLKSTPPGLSGLERSSSDIYYGNFSVFQSLPDVWAIDQVFPIMPVHRHDTRPTRQAIIADITCDSDGKIDRFIGAHGVQNTLPVHPLIEGQPYYFGVFLVGAYQETLGDLHNLMGDTNVVSVRITADNTFEFVQEMNGDSVADVLSYVEYQPQRLLEQFRKIAEKAVRDGRISVAQRQAILEAFIAGLRGYPYLED